jgi:hypothetical protein
VIGATVIAAAFSTGAVAAEHTSCFVNGLAYHVTYGRPDRVTGPAVEHVAVGNRSYRTYELVSATGSVEASCVDGRLVE